LLPHEASNLTLALGCGIPLAFLVGSYFLMRRIGKELPLFAGVITVITYTVVISFLFLIVFMPMLDDLNRSLTFQKIQNDLDTQCGIGKVDAYAGVLDDSTLSTWQGDADVRCVLAADNMDWICTCP
jgi:hypothetical protein